MSIGRSSQHMWMLNVGGHKGTEMKDNTQPQTASKDVGTGLCGGRKIAWGGVFLIGLLVIHSFLPLSSCNNTVLQSYAVFFKNLFIFY